MIKSGDVCEVTSNMISFWEFDEIKQEWGEAYSYKNGKKFLVLKLLKPLGNPKNEIVKILIDGTVRYFYYLGMYYIKCLNE